jgi:POT family proton-dependent oligopeptide transporter
MIRNTAVTDATKQRILLVMPRGLGALLLLQLFSVVTYSVGFIGLAHFATRYLHLSSPNIAELVFSFISLNFAVHVFTGFIGGRFFSFRILFLISSFISIAGIACLFWFPLTMSYWGLCLVALASGISPTCVNCIMTQLFKPEDKRRETAFLWNYSIMNLGFLIGFLLYEWLQTPENYPLLFLLNGILTLIAIGVVIVNWRKLGERNTVILNLNRSNFKKAIFIGSLLLLMVFAFVRYFIEYNHLGNEIIISIGIIMLAVIIFLAFKQPSEQARKKVAALIILVIVAIVFWSINLLVPMGFKAFIEQNVHQQILGWHLSSNVLNNLNALVIIVFGPILGVLFYHFRYRGMTLSIPMKFTIGMLLAGIALLFIPVALSHGDQHGQVHGAWFTVSYFLQGIAELFIQPIGLAMIGQLAPIRLQSIFMGYWMMIVGIAGIFADFFSSWVQGTQLTESAETANIHFAHVFNLLGWLAIVVAFVLIALRPLLTKLINYRSLDPTLQKK